MQRTSTRVDDVVDNAVADEAEQTHTLDLLASGLVLGVAAIFWFGWGSSVDVRWSPLLLVGMASALLSAIGCALVRRGARGRGTHEVNAAAGRIWTRWVVVETVLILGAGVGFGRIGWAAYVAPWTLGVVGLHFLPLARLYRLRSLVVAGWCCVGVGLIATLVHGFGWGDTAPVTIAGTGGGLVMVATSLGSLTVGAQRIRSDRGPAPTSPGGAPARRIPATR